jgi:AICAR transformylase/IMP cyclohydrolase PurH
MKTFQEFQIESKSQQFKDRLENLKKRSDATDAAAQQTASQARSHFDKLSTAINKYRNTVKTDKKANPHADEE